MKTDKITVRLTANQHLVLEELHNKLGCNVSGVVRYIIGDFLTRNEDVLERIISGEVNVEDYANYSEARKKA